MRIERGRDLLADDYRAPFSPDEVAELRRVAGIRPTNPMQLGNERTGGNAPGTRPANGWFSKALEGL